ncbi:MAG: hypothetical protein AAF449_17760, partial [Myxococcota bacterium]
MGTVLPDNPVVDESDATVDAFRPADAGPTAHAPLPASRGVTEGRLSERFERLHGRSLRRFG